MDEDTDALPTPLRSADELEPIVYQVNSLEQMQAVLSRLPRRSTLVTPLDVVVVHQDGTDLVSVNHRMVGATDEFALPEHDTDSDTGC